ncbi:MAG: hypothetical protein JO359_15260 [Candidatus Eremiobacteraeota bacterium]|nr:hypothetical protein [Candidatus Eremiobacteraeota bacterium]
MDDNSIAALAVVCIFGLPIVGWILIRFMQHSERMAMIKHGIVPPQGNPGKWDAGARWASPHNVAPPDAAYNYEAQIQLRRGIRTTFIGLALFIGLSFIGFRGDGSFVPGPWLLGGLIPMFVGIAQVISAVLAGAEFSRPRPSTYAPQPPPSQPPPQAPPPSGPYTYRPPGNQEELPRSKPPQQL